MKNKKKKGFTLIELLAIIVILAIIAVITVPIILNIIENSKKGAATDSAYGYKDAVNKYYVSELSGNRELQLEGSYTVTDGVLNGSGISNKEIPVSGDKPSSGSLTYENNVLTSGCLVIGEYAVTFNENGTTSTEKGDCKIKVDFTTDSWSKIISNLNTDRSAYDDEIGKTKIIEFDRDGDNTNEYYKLRLVNTSACGDYTGSRTSCGVVIEFVTLIGTHNMNERATQYAWQLGDGNVGGWYSSAMRLYLNPQTETSTNSNSVFNKLPSDLQSVIIGTAPIVSSNGSACETDDCQRPSDDVIASDNFTGDKLFLLSCKEVGFGSSCDNKATDDDTRILRYYAGNNNDNSRKKYSTTTLAGEDNNALSYWLRSAYIYDYSRFKIVDNYGSSNVDGATMNHGVAPAFRIMD